MKALMLESSCWVSCYSVDPSMGVNYSVSTTKERYCSVSKMKAAPTVEMSVAHSAVMLASPRVEIKVVTRVALTVVLMVVSSVELTAEY